MDALQAAGIEVGVITNHNKFDFEEFKTLRKAARKKGIFLLPGVELSVGDGANGIHALIVFHEEWIAEGKDYINLKKLANTEEKKKNTRTKKRMPNIY